MKSKLQFNDYQVLETYYKYDPDNQLEEETVSPDFNLKIQYLNNEKTEAFLNLGVRLGDKNLDQNSFYMEAQVLGRFLVVSGDEDLPEGFVENMFRKNALAILYPYMRALVTTLSNNGSEAPIMLPPMNIAEMIESKDKIEELNFEEDS
ncbi:protein-export chaperone SecB [Alkalicoccus urumqiensis]|uniref:Preprotein translocase subunit SecB n=1 Tax=Alkalicoccus urumqiensis TaxID=1548213 RepID=A0A2P6ME64_ALKUR|nr:protein-export chaperone SecB [Alkalicoccus urumqiensis]PRO64556.1 hypothetical protein C6I21_13740 [Alkalicoccus urumqiensis]